MMTSEITLYHHWRSSCSWRVRWALKHKSLFFKSVLVDLSKGENKDPKFLTLSPAGYVPVITAKELDRPLTESLAILEWLDERFPHKPLYPRDPEARAYVRQICLTVVAGIQPVQNLRVLNEVEKIGGNKEDWAKTEIHAGLQVLEQLLKSHTNKTSDKLAPRRHAWGENLTAADLCVVPQVYNAHRFQVDMTPFPLTNQIYEYFRADSMCASSAPESYQA